MKIQFKTLSTVLIAILGSYLFFEEFVGLNMLIFSSISVAFVCTLYPNLSIAKKFSAITPVMLCAFFLVFYPQTFTVLMWMLSYLVMWSVMAFDFKPVLIPFHGASSMIVAPLYDFGEIIKENPIKRDSTLTHKLSTYLIVALIVLVFVLLYSSSNPIFSKFIPSIKWDSVYFELFAFTIFIYGIHHGLVKFRKNNFLASLNESEIKISDGTISEENGQYFNIAHISFWSLTAILAAVNLLDIVVLLTGKLPEGITYSEYVHQGFFTLIFSMILAIGLIVYFYRGQLYFHQKVLLLKRASYFWIAQNLLLALITANKNLLYVSAYGLTYKRIAVFLFLICIVIGLILCISKIKYPYTNWHFFNRLTKYAFVIFLFAALIPYDYIITHYNVKNIDQLDATYLLYLDHPDYKLLHSALDATDESQSDIIEKTEVKMQYLSTVANTSGWQSWNYYRNSFGED